MPHDAECLSWITLLETRDRLMKQLRHDVPSAWQDLIGDFLDDVRAIPGPLPPGALLLLLPAFAALASIGQNPGLVQLPDDLTTASAARRVWSPSSRQS
jgi:hypothetical protein